MRRGVAKSLLFVECTYYCTFRKHLLRSKYERDKDENDKTVNSQWTVFPVVSGFASTFTIHILYHKMSKSQHKTNKNKQI